MKRKLPQWLLDATNNNQKNPKPNPTESKRKHSNESHNDISLDTDNQPAQHSISEQQPSNGTIAIVPLANLLSPSRGGNQISESHRNVSNETELRPADSTSMELGIGSGVVPVVIKTETPEANEPTASSATDEQQAVVKQEIKDEPIDTTTSSSTVPAPPSVTLVPKVEDVKPERRSCNYGIKCFRQNAAHRTELAHPGDVDYRRPNLPSAPPGTPACPWGASCYRRNPQHFMQLSHPPSTNTITTTVAPVPQITNLPQRRNRNATGNGRMAVVDDDSDRDEDDYDLEDPFINDGSSDEYVPDGDDDDDDDDEDELEDSQPTDT